MKNNVKRTAILLAALLAAGAVLTACGDSAQTPVSTDTAAVSAENTASVETEEQRLQSTLPEDLNFNGTEINIWYFTKNSDAAEHFYDIAGNLEGDIVDEALYERNRAMEEQLGVTLNFVDTGVASSDVGTNVRKVVMAGDTTYDLYSVIQWNSVALALEHCFMNLSDAPYIAWDQPWWSQSYNEEMQIGQNHAYFLAGDISIDLIRCISAMYFNKTIFTALYDSSEILYQEVLDGKWTVERLKTYIADAYSDVNGNGTVDEGDRYGLKSNTYNNIDSLTFAQGARFTERDSDNLPTLIGGNEHNVSIWEGLSEILLNTVGVEMNTTASVIVDDFENGNVLFMPGYLYTSENLREMTDDYGIIPQPKYDENQEEYLSSVHDIATLLCIPTTCQKVDAVCALLEAMAYYSYYEVTPVYYETALKTKYTRDELSSQIIDIIHDGSMTDFAYVYQASLNSAGMVMRELAAAKKTDYVSYWTKKEKSCTKALDKFITKFLAEEN